MYSLIKENLAEGLRAKTGLGKA
jgi:hypothetical protein